MAVVTDFIPPEVILGTTTSWLPVTTAYPSVSGCATAFFLFPGQPEPYGWDPGYGYFAGGSLTCLPPAETSWWEQVHQNPDGYTSLSIRPLVCPEAFTTAVTEVFPTGSTLVLCCPSGYDLEDGQPGIVTGKCRSSLTSGQVITYLAENTDGYFTSTSTTFKTASDIGAIGMTGWNVAASTSSVSSISSVSSASTAIASQTSTNAPQSSSGLSTGAKAGIGVGAALGVLAIIGATWILATIFVSRRYRTFPNVEENRPNAEENRPPANQPPLHEIDGRQPVYEMRHKQYPVEMNAAR